MGAFIDLTGQVFGRLTVIERAPNRPGRGTARWHCRCECGDQVEHYSSNLLRGRVRKCGSVCVLAAGRLPWPSDPRYYVGRDGSVVSPAGVLLQPWLNTKGYPVVGVYPTKKCWPIGVHIMVCETYHGSRPEGMQVAHEDGDESNPHADNLSWKTPKDNCADKERHGTMLRGETIPVSKLREADIRTIRSLHEGGQSQRSLAARFDVTRQNIGFIVRRETWRHVA